MKTKLRKFLIPLLCGMLIVPIQAQVTIGSDKPPVVGALLDLKQYDPQPDNTTSLKGLGMPRVEITQLNPSDPAKLPISIGNLDGGSWDLDEHIGLTVYNIRENLCFSPEPLYKGMYVWDGSYWQYLGEKISSEMQTYTDTRPQKHGAQTYYYRNFGAAGNWMTENLRYVPLDGSITPMPSTTPAYGDKHYAYPQVSGGSEPNYLNITTWSLKQGVFYSYSAATIGRVRLNLNDGNNDREHIDNPTQGVCPDGWHVPTDYEWSQLEEEMALNPAKYSTVKDPTPWNPRLPGSPPSITDDADYYAATFYRPRLTATTGHSTAMMSPCPVAFGPAVTGKSNLTTRGGFNILLVGSHNLSAVNYGVGYNFWTSSNSERGTDTPSDIPIVAWSRAGGEGVAGMERMIWDTKLLMSVRCKKND